MLQIGSLTMRELREARDLTGIPVPKLLDGFRTGETTVEALQVFAYLARRREDPEFTYEQTQDMTLDEVNAIVGVVPADPTDAAS